MPLSPVRTRHPPPRSWRVVRFHTDITASQILPPFAPFVVAGPCARYDCDKKLRSGPLRDVLSIALISSPDTLCSQPGAGTCLSNVSASPFASFLRSYPAKPLEHARATPPSKQNSVMPTRAECFGAVDHGLPLTSTCSKRTCQPLGVETQSVGDVPRPIRSVIRRRTTLLCCRLPE